MWDLEQKELMWHFNAGFHDIKLPGDTMEFNLEQNELGDGLIGPVLEIDLSLVLTPGQLFCFSFMKWED